MLQRPNERGNGAELSWREMVQLMDPHNKITKGTHTQDLPDQTIPGSSERLLSFLFLGSTNQTKEKSQEENLHLGSLMDFLLSRLRVSQWLERVRIVTLFIGSLCWCDVMNQRSSLLSPKLYRSHLQYPASQG